MTLRTLGAALCATLAACSFKADPDRDVFTCQADPDCGSGWICVPQLDGTARSLCVRASEVSGEACNAADDDRNGVVDDIPESGEVCDTGALGACAKGTLACVEGELVCSGGAPHTELCDGADNDCNGITDDTFDLFNDLQNCGSCNHACGEGEGCSEGACVEAACDDTLDNDGNAAADCADEACDTRACGPNGKVCFEAACVCLGAEPVMELTCSDAQDNDCDGLVDCADPDCLGDVCDIDDHSKNCGLDANAKGACLPREVVCSGGLDEDGDAQTDCADPDCNGLSCSATGSCTAGTCPPAP